MSKQDLTVIDTAINPVLKKRYSVHIEGLDNEIVDIMYGAGMTDAIASFEVNNLEDKTQIYDGVASGWEQPEHVPKEDLKLFVNELDLLSDKAKSNLLEKGKHLIDGDYWIVSIVDNFFNSKQSTGDKL